MGFCTTGRLCGIKSSAKSGQPLGQAQWGKAQQTLTPILAHELLHIRRGDLWVGLLQTLAQAVWWSHPLMWWVNRLTTREAERCCDEEVLAELGCGPAAYAGELVDVLELKWKLKPVPESPACVRWKSLLNEWSESWNWDIRLGHAAISLQRYCEFMTPSLLLMN